MSDKEIKIFPTVDELNQFAANEFVKLSNAAIAERGEFTVALSGGSTPKKLFQLLASDEFRSQIDWQKIQFFFGDERIVLPTDSESNYRMANDNLFSKLKIPKKNIHRFFTEELIEFMESDYPGCGFGRQDNIVKLFDKLLLKMENVIRKVFKLQNSEFPRFDLIFLGMGADGHTASLFPETDALKEDKKIVVANDVEKLDTTRLTMTFPTINNAKNIIFLIAGEDKAEALHEVLNGKPNKEKFPSQGISPSNGNLLFLIDEKAGAKLA